VINRDDKDGLATAIYKIDINNKNGNTEFSFASVRWCQGAIARHFRLWCQIQHLLIDLVTRVGSQTSNTEHMQNATFGFSSVDKHVSASVMSMLFCAIARSMALQSFFTAFNLQESLHVNDRCQQTVCATIAAQEVAKYF